MINLLGFSVILQLNGNSSFQKFNLKLHIPKEEVDMDMDMRSFS